MIGYTAAGAPAEVYTSRTSVVRPSTGPINDIADAIIIWVDEPACIRVDPRTVALLYFILGYLACGIIATKAKKKRKILGFIPVPF